MLSSFNARPLVVILMCLFSAASMARESNPAREKLAAQGIDFSPARWVQYAAQGDTRMIELFLEAGISVNVQEPMRHVSALHNAASQGHLGLVKRLVEKGADPNRQDWNGYTPLINAAFAGHQLVVEYLIAHGAKVNIVPSKGPTALVAAIQSSNSTVVKSLLKAGANVELAASNGITPRQAAELSMRKELLGDLMVGVHQ